MATGARPAAADTDFRALFSAHAQRLVRFAMLLGAADPEDVAQEAFCRLYERRNQLHSGVEESAPYLNRTVVNIVRDRHRRGGTARRWGTLARHEAELTAPSAEDASLRSEEARRVIAALDALPNRRREAVVLRYWLDLSYSEIAAAMGTGVGSAKSAVSRGLDDLHSHLEEK